MPCSAAWPPGGYRSAPPAHPEARSKRPDLRSAVRDDIGRGGVRARVVRHAREGLGLRREQLSDVRCASRRSFLRTELELVDRLPGQAVIPARGVAGGAVVREAHRALQFEVLREGQVLEDRNQAFEEDFLHVEGTADRRLLIAGDRSRLGGGVGHEVGPFVAIFAADGHPDRTGRKFEQRTLRGDLADLLDRLILQRDQRADVTRGFRRDAAGTEQIDRHATGRSRDRVHADEAAAADRRDFARKRSPRVQRLLQLDLVVVAAVELAFRRAAHS